THAPGSKEISRPLLSFLNFRIIALATAAVGLIVLIAALISIGSSDNKNSNEVEVNNSKTSNSSNKKAPEAVSNKDEDPSEASKSTSESTVGQPTVAENEKVETPVPPKFKGKVRAIEQNWLSIRSDDS